MSEAEQFINDYTNHCSNELVGGVYHEWLTPDQARKAVEIAREEVINQALEWLKFNLQDYAGLDDKKNQVPFDKDVFDAFREAMGVEEHTKEIIKVYGVANKYVAILEKGNYAYSAQGQTRDIAIQKVKEMSNTK